MFSISKPVFTRLSLIVSASLLPYAPAHAASKAVEETMPVVIVSATRTPTPASRVASSVTVITAKDIEQKQQRTLPDVLQGVPGIHMVQTGVPGGNASIFTRGTNANHTKVLIDGIEVSDPSVINGAFDFSQVLASNIDRVEVLRGPQSGLYGSDAIGGVINVITKKGTGPAQFSGSIEGGSHSTFNQTAGVRGAKERFHYAFDAAHYRVENAEVTPTDLVPAGRAHNNDTYDNRTVSTKLGADLTDNFDVGFVGRFIDSTLQFTGDDGTGPQTARSTTKNSEYFTRGTGHLVLFDGKFEQTFGLGYTYFNRPSKDPNPGAFSSFDKFTGTRAKADWQGDIKVMEGQLVSVGLEHQQDEIESLPNAQAYNRAAFVQLQSSLGDRVFNSIALRHDDHEKFGGKTTYRVAPAYLHKETGTKLKASIGSGYKAPSLDQLFHDYTAFGFFANPNLQPETSTGYDVGFEQYVWNNKIQFGSTYFQNDIKNLIASNSAFTTNVNIGKAKTWGFENFIDYKMCESLRLRSDYTFTIAENDITGKSLVRRPKHKASFTATWQATDKLSLSGTVLYNGSWLDSNRAGTNSSLRPGGYGLLNLAASYDLGEGFAAFTRIDNALNKGYESPVGFQNPGFGIYGGIKFNFDVEEKP